MAFTAQPSSGRMRDAGVVEVTRGDTGQRSEPVKPDVRGLQLSMGKSAILEVHSDITDVILGNPNVADVVVRSRRHVYVVGIAPGETNAVLLGGDNRKLMSVDVRVTRDLAPLESALRDLIPASRIRVRALADAIVLTGEAQNPAEAANALALAERFTGKPERVVNLLTVRSKEQVLLTVTIAEINRNNLERLGVQWQDVAVAAGAVSTQITAVNAFALTSGIVAPAGAAGAARSGATASAALAIRRFEGRTVLEALQRSGAVRILAEPNLTAISGEMANFLAGGEFPVPVSREDDQLSFAWKPFGVGLAFTPVVLSEGRISLKIATEVSNLSVEGAVQSGGLAIPAISVRRVTSSVELPSGGAVVLAGLLSEETRQNADAVPGLRSLPVLGQLFESQEFTRSQTELVVIVAPYLVDSRSRDAFMPRGRIGGRNAWAGSLEMRSARPHTADRPAFSVFEDR